MEKHEIIDLRSDTVTLPTEEMLEAIKHAQLGDDVFREDPTVNRLEEMAASRTGKEAALLVTSGTQANLVSLMSNTKHGELIILEQESHIYWYEVGGISAIAGLLPWPLKSEFGALSPEDVKNAIRPRNIHFPEPKLICVENTHNRHGGTVITPKQLQALSEIARAHGLKLYMDGARIFNAAVALKTDVKNLTRHVDNLMFCLSKGLSCPVGSVIAGSREFIEKARKIRKLLGGGMRQAGIIAAPGVIALEKMIDRLEGDHKNAKHLAEGLAKIDCVKVDMRRVQTNIVIADISDLHVSAELFLEKLKQQGVLALANDKHKIRMVTHRGVEKEHISKAITAVSNVVNELTIGSIVNKK
ncbi:MAG: low-specificity L-threonine aldolase [Candidatus Bathyarchaeia archaeon]